MTRSWDDERISRLVERAGLEGYGFYFRLVEIIAANMEENSKPNATYSAQKWSKLTAIFKPKVQKLCEVCSDLGLIEFEINSDLLKVSIPKIIKYRDEYSVKQGRKKVKSPDTVRTMSGATPEQEQIQKQIQIEKQNASCEKPKKEKRTPFDANAVELPECLKTDAFSEAWTLWQQHRKEKKNPLTPTATKQQLKKLEEMGEARAVAAIGHSIAGGYTGIFEPKDAAKQGLLPDDPNRPPGAVRKTASGWWLDKNGAVVVKPEFS